MIGSDEFLQVFDLILTAEAPVFIGCGKTILKKNYLYDSRTNQVSIFDEEKLFALLFEKNLEDPFERFMLGRFDNLLVFLTRDCHLTETDWKPALRYVFDAGAALDARHTLTDIQTFIRDAAGRVYIPGSGVKGALRTVLLHQLIREEGKEYFRLEQTPKSRAKFGVIPEERYLHTLKLKPNRPDDAVNSLLRGIQISDSTPISDKDMVLADKWDCQPDGTLKKVPVCRESIRPGTRLCFKLTLDQSILKGAVTRKRLLQAVNLFDDYYWNTYLCRFEELAHDEAEVAYKNCLFLGGGAGFFSKSLVYPYLGEERGLKITAEMMQFFFKSHHHDRDESLKVSPHTLKYTRYQGQFYPMGMCGVEIQ